MNDEENEVVDELDDDTDEYDFTASAVNMVRAGREAQIDIASFGAVLGKKREIFLERRKKYGSHLENASRFPNEHPSGLYLKCVRMIRMIENGDKLDVDTLLDLSNYTDIIASSIQEDVI